MAAKANLQRGVVLADQIDTCRRHSLQWHRECRSNEPGTGGRALAASSDEGQPVHSAPARSWNDAVSVQRTVRNGQQPVLAVNVISLMAIVVARSYSQTMFFKVGTCRYP
jgi:hypothetical protein